MFPMLCFICFPRLFFYYLPKYLRYIQGVIKRVAMFPTTHLNTYLNLQILWKGAEKLNVIKGYVKYKRKASEKA